MYNVECNDRLVQNFVWNIAYKANNSFPEYLYLFDYLY